MIWMNRGTERVERVGRFYRIQPDPLKSTQSLFHSLEGGAVGVVYAQVGESRFRGRTRRTRVTGGGIEWDFRVVVEFEVHAR